MSKNAAQFEALTHMGRQIRYALDHYQSHGQHATSFQHVIIAGLGGSGIGGRIAKAWFTSSFPLPIEVVADYSLPAYAGKQSFIILGSYSGNTEETLAAYEKAKEVGAFVITMSSGGKLTEWAKRDELICEPIESGYQPRMALGYSLTYQLLILAELAGQSIQDELREISHAVESEREELEETGGALMERFSRSMRNKFVVVSDAWFEPIGIRLAQQIQENAKAECFVHVIPEMNHNVIESYYGQVPTNFIFLHSQLNERVDARFDFLHGLLQVENNQTIQISISSYTLKSIYETIYRFDFFSLLLADSFGVDGLNVPNIASLKEYLEHC